MHSCPQSDFKMTSDDRHDADFREHLHGLRREARDPLGSFSKMSTIEFLRLKMVRLSSSFLYASFLFSASMLEASGP